MKVSPAILGAMLILVPVSAVTMPVAYSGQRVYVPIDRVVKNLEREYYEHPDSAALAWRLGRLHAVAFAQKRDSVAVIEQFKRSHDGKETAFEQEMTPEIPRAVRITEDARANEAAGRHLVDAIRWHETAHRLSANNSAIMLGYGWCLQQAGRKGDARDCYRDIVELAFNDADSPTARDQAVTSEALRYLIDLLHPVLNWRELRERREQLKTVKGWPTVISPIAIPLGICTTLADIVRDDIEVCFDVDGSGRDLTWTWIDPSAGWLVHDFDGQGGIASGRQLFGEVTFWVFWNNGYEALASLDDNGDRWLRHGELNGLKIWNDWNSDGVCDRSELRGLAEYGINGLSCGYVETFCNGRRMWVSEDGVEYTSGRRGPSYDVVLKVAHVVTVVR